MLMKIDIIYNEEHRERERERKSGMEEQEREFHSYKADRNQREMSISHHDGHDTKSHYTSLSIYRTFPFSVFIEFSQFE